MNEKKNNEKIGSSFILLTFFTFAFIVLFIIIIRKVSFQQEIDNYFDKHKSDISGTFEVLNIRSLAVSKDAGLFAEKDTVDDFVIKKEIASVISNKSYDYIYIRYENDNLRKEYESSEIPRDLKEIINLKIKNLTRDKKDEAFIFRSSELDYSLIVYIEPIETNKKINGYFVACEKYENVFGLPVSIDNTGMSNYISIDKDGNLVNYNGQTDCNDENINLFAYLENDNKKGNNNSRLKNDIRNKKDGYVTVEVNDNRYILIYVLLDGDTGYYSILKVEESAMWKNSTRIISYAFLLCIFFSIILISILINIRKKERQTQKKIRQLAYMDSEFNVYNMNYFAEKFEEIVKNNKEVKKNTNQRKNYVYAYASIDIKNFKSINNTFGYVNGTNILKIIANELKGEFQTKNKEAVFHVSGDIFGIILRNDSDKDIDDRMKSVINNINKQINEFFSDAANLEFSIGIFLIKEGIISPRVAIDGADLARKDVKNNYYENIEFYNNDLKKKIEQKLEIERQMESALEKNEFEVYLQPKMNMITSVLHGSEALIRWNHPEKGLIMPGKFIPVFEENGFIIKLDMYIYEKICETLTRWKHEDKNFHRISVNMSRLHLNDEKFVEKLVEIAEKYKVSTKDIEIEMTENIFFGDMERFNKVGQELKKAGFILSVDDFGSAFSSLNILKDLPVDVIKLDKLFLSKSKNIEKREKSEKIIKNIITMVKDLKLEIVMEGIETKEQAELITSYGCEIAQGFYYAKPMKIKEFEQYAIDHSEETENETVFLFNNNLKDESGKYEGISVGQDCTYVQGLKDDEFAISIPGGDIMENFISLPKELLSGDSYTICFWLKYGTFTEWQSVFYAEYEDGFMAVNPLGVRNLFIFRNKYFKEDDKWYDTIYMAAFRKKKWYHVAVSYNGKTNLARLCINGEAVAYKNGVPKLHGVKNIYLGGDIYQKTTEINIARLRISNVVKSTADIKEIYEKEVVERLLY